MTQVSLDKLSKKNQEFVRIATHQLIKDGKTDEEIKALLEEIIPTILENQAKASPLADFMEHQLFGQQISQKQNKKKLRPSKKIPTHIS